MDVQADLASPAPKVPPHVPAALVRDVSLFDVPGLRADPFGEAAALHEQGRVFYNIASRKGGSWVLTRAEDIRHVLQHPNLFSSKSCAGFSMLVGEAWDMIPLELDPPEHGKFRALMTPWLSPGAVAKMADRVRERAVDLIDPIVKQGGCEFMAAFGRPFPVSIFMELMGLPHEETAMFLAWEEELLHNPGLEPKMVAARQILDYLRALTAERRKRPTDDLTSKAVFLEVDGRPLTDDEVIGMCYLLFVGGLDTVASSLGFYFNHLATHPDAQQRLRSEPRKIPHAVEEYLRSYSVVTTVRHVTADTQLAGVEMKRGDWVTVNYAAASLDPLEFSQPTTVDLDRKGVRHFGFAFGPHFCLGSHLAKRELNVALEEWTTRVPPFRLAADQEVKMHGGGVFGVDTLHLEWS